MGTTAELETKQSWDSCHFDQHSTHSIYLSGHTVICGQLKICGPTGFSASYGAGVGKVMTSNASGIGIWETPKGENITKLICQTSHGFVVNDVIGFGSGVYSKPIANGLYNGEVLGLVTKCYNANCFDLTQAGYISGLTGLVINNTYFLSDVTPGLLTATEPSIIGHISKAVIIADTSTSGWVLPYPGYYITTGGTTGTTAGITGATNGLCKFNSNNVCLGGTLTSTSTISVTGAVNALDLCATDGTCCNLTRMYCGIFASCGCDSSLTSRSCICVGGNAQISASNNAATASNSMQFRPDAVYFIIGGTSSGPQYAGDYCVKFNNNCRSIPDVDWVKRYVTANTTASMSGTANRLAVFNATGNNVCNTTATFISNTLCNSDDLILQVADTKLIYLAAKSGSLNYLTLGSPTQAGVGGAYICPAGTSANISIYLVPKGAGACNYIIASNNYIGPTGPFINGFSFTPNVLTLPINGKICGSPGSTALSDATTVCICGGWGYVATGYAGAGGSIYICGGCAVDGIGGTPKAGGDVMLKAGVGISGGANGLICMCGQVCASSTITA